MVQVTFISTGEMFTGHQIQTEGPAHHMLSSYDSPWRTEAFFLVVLCSLEPCRCCVYFCAGTEPQTPQDFTEFLVQWGPRGSDSRCRTLSSGGYLWRHSSRIRARPGLMGEIDWDDNILFRTGKMGCLQIWTIFLLLPPALMFSTQGCDREIVESHELMLG